MAEAEWILASTANAELVHLRPTRWFEWTRNIQRRLLYHDRTKTLFSTNPGLESVQLKGWYDLLVLVCPLPWDALNINAIRDWKKKCRVSVCWIDELWVRSVDDYRYWLPLLAEFDHVILGLSGSVEKVSQSIGRVCHHVPGAVDAIRFAPYPTQPARVIDVYSVGRRHDGMHRALCQLVDESHLFYLYDTVHDGGDQRVRDLSSHRNLYASIAKRSRYFLVAPAKFDRIDENQGQVEVPFRYFEGAASGAILVGQSPDSPSYRALFDWPDAVIEVRPDGSDLVATLEGLARDTARQLQIRRCNTVQALTRHDWIYRWMRILEIAGFEPTREMKMRERRLRNLAEMAQSS